MKPREIKHNLVRNSKGIYYYFYINGDGGIECNIYDESGLYIEGLIVIKNGIMNFASTIDGNDDIHLIVINNSGNILHFFYSDENWNMKNIHNIDIKDKYCKYLKVFKHKGHLDIYMGMITAFPYKSWTIDHLKYSENKKSLARIFKSMNQSGMDDFYIDYDDKDNIHILFKSSDAKKYQIFYNINNPFTNTWGQVLTKLSNSNLNILDSHMFADSRGVIHTTWTVFNNSSFNLVYKMKDPFTNSEDKWSFYNLPREIGDIKNPVIFNDNGYLRILYTKNNILKGFYSPDFGYNWSPDEFFNNLRIDDFTLIPYSDNYMFNKDDTKIKYIYGKINEQYLLLYDGNIKEKFTLIEHQLSSKQGDNKILSNNYEVDNLNVTNSSENKDDDSTHEDKVLESEMEILDSFLKSVKVGIDTILNDYNIDLHFKEDIQELINENITSLKDFTFSNSDNLKEFINKLKDLEEYISIFKLENEKALNLLKSLNNIYEENLTKITSIESELEILKEEIKESENQGLLSKLKNIFK